MTLDNIYIGWRKLGVSRLERRIESVKVWGFQKQPRPTVEKQESADEDAHIKMFIQTWVYSIGPLAQHGGTHPRSEEDRAGECDVRGEEMRQEGHTFGWSEKKVRARLVSSLEFCSNSFLIFEYDHFFPNFWYYWWVQPRGDWALNLEITKKPRMLRFTGFESNIFLSCVSLSHCVACNVFHLFVSLTRLRSLGWKTNS